MLVTNDEENPRVPIYVTGRVVPQISVLPESLMLGSVTRGQQISKKLVVSGKKPFKICRVKSDDASLQFKTDDKASDKHIIEVIFDAKSEAGDVKIPINISTDLGEKFTGQRDRLRHDRRRSGSAHGQGFERREGGVRCWHCRHAELRSRQRCPAVSSSTPRHFQAALTSAR